jgi:aminoglycoside phosphotransferase (APT) family kinase protein
MNQQPHHDGLPEARVREIAVEVNGAIPCTCRSVGWGNNQIWKIEYADRHDYLKRYLTGADAYRRELWALTALKGKLPVPAVLLAREDDGSGCPFVLTSGIGGKPLDKVDDGRVPLVAQMGMMLARLHNQQGKLGPLPAVMKPRLAPAVDAFLEATPAEFGSLINRDRVAAALQAVREPRRPVLTHGDFGDYQCLVADGQIAGVVDWESVGLGEPEIDLALAGAFLRAFRAPAEEAAFVDGYRQASRFRPDLNLYEDLLQVSLLSLHALWRGRGQDFEVGRARQALLRNKRA